MYTIPYDAGHTGRGASVKKAGGNAQLWPTAVRAVSDLLTYPLGVGGNGSVPEEMITSHARRRYRTLGAYHIPHQNAELARDRIPGSWCLSDHRPCCLLVTGEAS